MPALAAVVAPTKTAPRPKAPARGCDIREPRARRARSFRSARRWASSIARLTAASCICTKSQKSHTIGAVIASSTNAEPAATIRSPVVSVPMIDVVMPPMTDRRPSL
jgi:hypothetical protein